MPENFEEVAHGAEIRVDFIALEERVEHLEEELAEHLEGSESDADDGQEKSSSNKPKSKSHHEDSWFDNVIKYSSIANWLMVGFAGMLFTHWYQEKEVQIKQLEAVSENMGHLMGDDEDEKAAAINAVSTLANREWAKDLALQFPSPGAVSALEFLASQPEYSGSDKRDMQQAAADANMNLAERYYEEGKFSNAEVYYKQGIDASVKLCGRFGKNLIIPLMNLGVIYDAQGKYDLAEDALRKARFIAEKAYGSKDRRLAPILNRLGSTYLRLGNRAEAEKLYTDAAAISKSDPLDSAEFGLSQFGLGTIKEQIAEKPQDYEDAQKHFHEAVFAFESSPVAEEFDANRVSATSKLADSYVAIALELRNQSQFEKANQANRRALYIYRDLLYDLKAKAELKKAEDAEKTAEEKEEDKGKHADEHSSVKEESDHSTSKEFTVDSKDDADEIASQKAVDEAPPLSANFKWISTDDSVVMHPDSAQVYRGLAKFNLAEGKLPDARNNLNKSIKVASKFNDKEQLRLAYLDGASVAIVEALNAKTNKGSGSVAANNLLDQASKFADASIDIACEQFGPDSPKLIKGYTTLGIIHELNNHPDNSRIALSEAFRVAVAEASIESPAAPPLDESSQPLRKTYKEAGLLSVPNFTSKDQNTSTVRASLKVPGWEMSHTISNVMKSADKQLKVSVADKEKLNQLLADLQVRWKSPLTRKEG